MTRFNIPDRPDRSAAFESIHRVIWELVKEKGVEITMDDTDTLTYDLLAILRFSNVDMAAEDEA